MTKYLEIKYKPVVFLNFRAGKTEVLSDDLQEADRKVEYIRTACSNMGKKLGPMYSGQESREKRMVSSCFCCCYYCNLFKCV